MKEEKTELMPEWAAKLLADVDKLRDENKMLRDFAGKNKIASWTEAQQDKAQKFGHLKKLNDKIVIGWSTLDYSEFDPKAPSAMQENLYTTVYYLDGTQEKVNYAIFKNCNEQVKVKILANSGHDLVIQFDELVIAEYKLGKATFDIQTKFLNP